MNQTSTISALGPQFQKLLSVATNGDDENVGIGSRPMAKKKQRAKTFLSSLKERTKTIDGQLQMATDHILPPTRDAKTVIELAELCRLTQHATRDKLAILRRRLQEAGYRVSEPTADPFTEHLPSPSPIIPRKTIHQGFSPLDKSKSDSALRLPASPFPDDEDEQAWPLSSSFAVVGGPLESVLEADVETDGATTPGSFLSPLPSATNSAYAKRRGSLSAGKWQRPHSSSRRKASIGTPTTPPAMDSFSFSNSTNNFLQHMPFEQNDDVTDQQQETGGRNWTVMNNTFLGDSSQAGQLKSPKLTPSSGAYQNRRKSPHHSTADQNLLDDYHQFLPPHRVLNFEFREEDDMITLDTQSTMTRNTVPSPATSQLKRHSTSPATTASSRAASVTTRTPAMEGRSQFLARMEGMLDRVEESMLEDSYSAASSPSFSKFRVRFFQGDQASRPSDEMNSSLWRHNARQTILPRSPAATDTDSVSSTGNTRSEKSIRSTNSRPSLTSWSDRRKSNFGDMDGARCDDDDDTETCDDDSTNVVATIVNEKQSGTASRSANQTYLHPSTQERPTHILVDSGLASPAHTNITMDNTMIMNAAGLEEEEVLQLDSDVEDDEDNNDPELDNLSILTPLLDRYRVEPGGNTIKVIPNKRRPHPTHDAYKKKQLSRQTPTSRRVDSMVTTAFRNAVDPQEAGVGKEMDGITPVASNVPTSTFLSPPPTATQPLVTSRKKKVYRKTPLPKNYRSMDLSVGENDHPNLSTASSTVASPQPFKNAGAFVVPPLRPRPFDARRTPKTTRQQTEPMSPMISSIASSSLARAQQQWELQDVDRGNISDSTTMPSGRTNPVGICLSQQNSSSLNN